MTDGIPGLAGIEHVGLTVPNLEEAKRFFINVIGCKLVFQGDPISSEPEFMKTQLSVSPDASVKYCFLRCEKGPNLEIFEYCVSDQKKRTPKNSDIGGHHLAFYVEDIHQAIEYLQSKNVKIQGDVNFIDKGAAAGSYWVYFLAPWGLQLELVSFPDGKAYEMNSNIRLWHPKRPVE